MKRELLPGVSQFRITPPPVSPNFFPRHRLLDWVEGPAPRVLGVTAPTGFGKTVLGSQWAAKYPTITAWYTVSAEDSQRTAVFHVVEAIRRVKPGFADWVTEESDIQAMGAIAISKICEEIGRFGHDFHFVIDNLHLISPFSLPLLQAWVDNAPHNLSSLNLRQNVPTAIYGREQNMSILNYLTIEDLKFNGSEIALVARLNDIDPDDSRIPEAIAELDGWPIGIQMALADIDNLSVKNIHSSAAARRQNLVERVCLQLPEESLALLQKISLLQSISVMDLPDLGLPLNSMATLRELDFQGIYLERLSQNPDTYKVKEILKDFLILGALQNVESVREFVTKARDFFLSHSQVASAIRLLELVGDDQEALQLTGKYILELLLSADREAFLSHLVKLERNSLIGPASSIYLQGAFEIVTGNVERAIVFQKALQALLIAEGNIDAVSAELNLLEIRIAFFIGEYSKVTALARKSSMMPSSVHPQFATHLLSSFRAAATAAFMLEQEDITLEFLRLAEAAATDYPAIIRAVTLPSMRALVALDDGRLRDSLDDSLFALANAEKINVSGMFFPFEAVYCLAEIYRESADLSKAEEMIITHIPIAIKFHQWPWITSLRAKLALILAEQGRVTESLELIRTARHEVDGGFFQPDMLRVVDEHELLIRTSLVDDERVGELLFRLPTSTTTAIFHTTNSALQNKAKAGKLLDALPIGNPRAKLNKALIAADVYRDKPIEAEKFLREAIEIAMTNGFRTIFLKQSAHTLNNLLDLATKEPTIYLELLARDIRKQISRAESGNKIGNLDLTKRELEILRRLATELPISQIASTLHISNNTIKTHLRSLYRKMGVDSRQTAVAKGVELSLL